MMELNQQSNVGRLKYTKMLSLNTKVPEIIGEISLILLHFEFPKPARQSEGLD